LGGTATATVADSGRVVEVTDTGRLTVSGLTGLVDQKRELAGRIDTVSPAGLNAEAEVDPLLDDIRDAVAGGGPVSIGDGPAQDAVERLLMGEQVAERTYGVLTPAGSRSFPELADYDIGTRTTSAILSVATAILTAKAATAVKSTQVSSSLAEAALRSAGRYAEDVVEGMLSVINGNRLYRAAADASAEVSEAIALGKATSAVAAQRLAEDALDEVTDRVRDRIVSDQVNAGPTVETIDPTLPDVSVLSGVNGQLENLNESAEPAAIADGLAGSQSGARDAFATAVDTVSGRAAAASRILDDLAAGLTGQVRDLYQAVVDLVDTEGTLESIVDALGGLKQLVEVATSVLAGPALGAIFGTTAIAILSTVAQFGIEAIRTGGTDAVPDLQISFEQGGVT
jgi:hypothetical protein